MMTFRHALADHLNEQNRWYPHSKHVSGSDIRDVRVRWDEGETSDNEDYDLSPRPPSLEVQVELTDGTRCSADPGWVIQTLMRWALQMGEQ
jgi:hypothetical protein